MEELSNFILDDYVSLSLRETESELYLGNPRFNYDILIKDCFTGEELAACNILKGVEKKIDHGLDNGGAAKRRIENIKDKVSGFFGMGDLLELFFDWEYRESPDYNNHALRNEEGFSLSYKNQAAIVSGIMHAVSEIEQKGKKVIKLGDHLIDRGLKEEIYKELHPHNYYIPKRIEEIV